MKYLFGAFVLVLGGLLVAIVLLKWLEVNHVAKLSVEVAEFTEENSSKRAIRKRIDELGDANRFDVLSDSVTFPDADDPDPEIYFFVRSRWLPIHFGPHKVRVPLGARYQPAVSPSQSQPTAQPAEQKVYGMTMHRKGQALGGVTAVTVTCTTCTGDGTINGTYQCPTCKGEGRVQQTAVLAPQRYNSQDQQEEEEATGPKCLRCQGTGFRYAFGESTSCNLCDGTGYRQ